jgi:hypothetical protein
MNKVLQRISIAESQGWKHDICNVGKHGTKMSGWWMPCGAFTTDINVLPDYCNDLNACDDLLNHMQTIGFDCWLVAEGRARCCSFISQGMDIEFKVISDSFAHSICEAFLETLGLWKEEQ